MMTICIPCGYIYQANKPFDELAKTWCCPDCGASVGCFSVLDETLPEKAKVLDQRFLNDDAET